MIDAVKIRIATNADCDGIVALIDGVLREYNDRICLEEGGSEADLLDLQTGYFDRGGCFWVLESIDDKGRSSIMGTHATRPYPGKENVCTFKRLYLHRDLRGTHWGSDLMQVTIDWANEKQFGSVEFWSDTRFERAHRFFEKFGFQKTGRRREMDDSAIPYAEFHFRLELEH